MKPVKPAHEHMRPDTDAEENQKGPLPFGDTRLRSHDARRWFWTSSHYFSSEVRCITMKHNPLEKEIEKKIGDYAKSKGCLYWKLTSPANRAVPDRMICTNRGVVGFLEVKRKGCKPTELQLLKMKELKDRGHQVTWCDGVEAGCKFVDDLLSLNHVEV